MQPEHGNYLPKIARTAICRVLQVTHREILEINEATPWLAAWGASFVTLTQNGELRGCIGSLQAARSLFADVSSNAVSAALHDPRFSPLRPDEIDRVAVEVSVLSASQPLGFADEADALSQLHPGTDGVIFECGQYRSTFLPQVWESLAHPRQFLNMLKRKAGLPEDFWAEDVKLSRYTVSKWREAVFEEEY